MKLVQRKNKQLQIADEALSAYLQQGYVEVKPPTEQLPENVPQSIEKAKKR